MSLISKTILCFHCGKPGFGNRVILNDYGTGFESAKDSCKKCGAFKKTLIGKEFKKNLGAGAVTYFRPQWSVEL